MITHKWVREPSREDEYIRTAKRCSRCRKVWLSDEPLAYDPQDEFMIARQDGTIEPIGMCPQ